MAAFESRHIAFDCRFFRGDRPCIWHKETGVLCECEHYAKAGDRVLIVKLDAMGDVLRTTALLPALAKEHPAAMITWITRKESVPLLERNPFVTETIELGPEAVVHLQTRKFDRVINLDASKISAGLASMAQSERKDGFLLDQRGVVQPTNAAARLWLETGVFDDIKRAGVETYQNRMADILGLRGQDHAYVLELSAAERQRAADHFQSIGVQPNRPVIGINPGAGGRWPLKQWREPAYVELMDRVGRATDAQFVLLGGPAERDLMNRLKSACRMPVLLTGSDNSVRHFSALVDRCQVLVTGDTLAMHIGLARRVRTIVLFGPTSSTEIEMYGLGEKVVPDMTCLSCYKNACDFVPNCMDLISTDMVEAAVLRQLALASSAVGA